MIEDDRLNPSSTASETEVAALERKIDDLKSKYILFFAGETKQPPEQEREGCEKAIRKLIYGGAKTARMSMIIQNLAARFNLYNNLWLKQLNESESGVSKQQKKKEAAPPPAKPRTQPQAPAQPEKAKAAKAIHLSLNDEDSFEKLYAAYVQLLPKNSKAIPDKEKVINSMKAKMVTNNLVETEVSISLKNDKPSIVIKN
ncbi:MAG: hypothetical protein NTW95_02015 [Candidatus Aminicenantes bacterium]|nr:hypothetical protein [Candidatus Aminicenantes bacterium]